MKLILLVVDGDETCNAKIKIMSNCYVKVVGGLGNQLFQIAAGYAYSKKYDKQVVIDAVRWNAGQGNHVFSYKDTIFKNFEYGSADRENTFDIHEREFNYSELPYYSDNVALNGYFQSLKYFEEYQKDFVDMLNIPKANLEKPDSKKVAFHIRRGDYLLYPDIHYACKTDYFDRCFELFKDFDIDVFTDSPNYVLGEFIHQKFNLIQTDSELKDLTLMSRYNNIVCSNSTFSWWASFLGDADKKIIVPSKWFMDGRDHGDIYRQNMIKLDV